MNAYLNGAGSLGHDTQTTPNSGPVSAAMLLDPRSMKEQSTKGIPPSFSVDSAPFKI